MDGKSPQRNALLILLAVSRRKERVAYYRTETLKKIAETAGPGSNAPLEYLHKEEQISARNRRENLRLGSLVTGAAGIGLMIFLRGAAPEESAYLVGLIPLLIGVALFVYAQLLAPKGYSGPNHETLLGDRQNPGVL